VTYRIAVLGPGGVGGFVAAALTHAAATPVTLVARQATASQLARTGLSVRSRVLGEFTAAPALATKLEEPVDALIVATKATGLTDALERIHATPELVVPLLNGIDHLTVLRERFGPERVAAAVIRIESDRPRPGEIVQTSPAARIDVTVGDDVPVVAALRRAGLDVRTGGAEADVMWSKLARLCALALTTTAADRPIGEVRDDPRWRSALENAVAETVAVAVAAGARLSPRDTLAELDGAPAELGSSMQRDVAAGREPELDAIAGAVVRAGSRHDLRCPTVQWLAEQVARRAAA
jgi:2-dehydropantoate 2-reductase